MGACADGSRGCYTAAPAPPGRPAAALQLCILAGCDFLPNLPGVGIKKAHSLMRKYRSFAKVGPSRRVCMSMTRAAWHAAGKVYGPPTVCACGA